MSPEHIFVLLTSFVAITSCVQAEYVDISTPAGLPLSPTTNQVTRDRNGGPAVVEAVVDAIAQSCIFPNDNLFLRHLAKVETNDGLDPRTYNQFYSGGIWRVSEAMFNLTKAGTGLLNAQYIRIQEAFGIDWRTVTWMDLQKPLYSGLAAALFISMQNERVPLSIDGQAMFWHNHYHASGDPFTFTRPLGGFTEACIGSEILDVVFLLDATVSAENFALERTFIRHVVSALRIEPQYSQAAVYQYGGSSVVTSIAFGSYATEFNLLTGIEALTQATISSSFSDIGGAVTSVVSNAFPMRANAARVIVLITSSPNSNSGSIHTARNEAENRGVTVFTVSVGSSVSTEDLNLLATDPDCIHQTSVPNFQGLKDVVEYTQRTLCHEPMIVHGDYQCRFDMCRNVAFPMAQTTMSIVTNVTCGDGTVYVTTRSTQPGAGVADIVQSVSQSNRPVYAVVRDVTSKYVYLDFYGGQSVSCYAHFSPAPGNLIPHDTPEICEEWQFPLVNPCTAPNRVSDRLPYASNNQMFILCDLQNKMYLTKCPPEDPYFSTDCHYCTGPNSPALVECRSISTTNDSCGRSSNPCTQENLLANNYFFDCPNNEASYLQCDTWGKAYVRTCPPNEVWRQAALTCEYVITTPGGNPCHGTSGFYPYLTDPHKYIMCNDQGIPYIMSCNLDFVWDVSWVTCVPPGYGQPSSVTQRPVTYATQPVHLGMYSPPCTQQAIAAMELYHPYSLDPTKYIQCDLWGESFLMSCQFSFYYNPLSHTCVDGPVVPDLVG